MKSAAVTVISIVSVDSKPEPAYPNAVFAQANDDPIFQHLSLKSKLSRGMASWSLLE